MSTKIIVWVVVIIIVGLGGYFVYTNYFSGASTGDPTEEVQDQVQVQDVTVGEGMEAVAGAVVSVLYTGSLEDGTVFDSSEANGNEPLVFVLGQPDLIPGFQIGINGMRVGGERVMVVPPSLGYGDQEVRDPDGNVIIPASVNIVFSVTLLDVQEAPEEVPDEGAATDEEGTDSEGGSGEDTSSSEPE